ncbi:unnamed protein product [Gordionus sp. m RMFG-2023]
MLACEYPEWLDSIDVLLNFLPCNISGNHLSSNETGAICYMGTCRNRSDLQQIDGSWGSWTSWSNCSESMAIRSRKCDSPEPEFGGRHCPGDRVEDKICANSISSDNERNQAKCTSHNNISMYNPIDTRPCVLLCYIPTEFTNKEIGNVASTTLVRKENSLDICAGNTPIPVGCDDVLYSTAKWDNCGVCEGDNSTCVSFVETNTSNLYNITEIANLSLNTTYLYFRLEKEYNEGSTEPRSIIALIRNGTTYSGTQINELTDLTYDVTRQREIVRSTALIAPLIIKIKKSIDTEENFTATYKLRYATPI